MFLCHDNNHIYTHKKKSLTFSLKLNATPFIHYIAFKIFKVQKRARFFLIQKSFIKLHQPISHTFAILNVAQHKPAIFQHIHEITLS